MVLRYANQWLVGYREVREVELRLFCFPFAGGGVRLFRDWSKHLPSNMEILTVQLPGRGSRMGEPALDAWGDLVGTIGEAMGEVLDKPFAFFGHSFGALLAFEMTRHLRRQAKPLPRGLFVSACGAPQFLLPAADPIHSLPDGSLVEKVKKWGGVPPEILEYPEALSVFLPPLRGDLKLLETYRYREEEPLPMPIDVFGGRQDEEVPEFFLQGWNKQTRERFSLTMVDGDHFFIEKKPDPLWRALNDWAGFHLAYNSFW
jgi:surfactin synthase thioesterase subunit